MTIDLTAQDKTTLRTAAFGAVTLLAYAASPASAHKVSTDGTLSFAAATGTVGHTLASKKRDFKLDVKSGAALADQVLPALADSVRLLGAHDPKEAANFQATVTTAVAAAGRAHKGEPSPGMTAMAEKIAQALQV